MPFSLRSTLLSLRPKKALRLAQQTESRTQTLTLALGKRRGARGTENVTLTQGPLSLGLGILAPAHLNTSWVLLLLHSSNAESIECANSLFIILTSPKHRNRVMALEGYSGPMGPTPSCHRRLVQAQDHGSLTLTCVVSSWSPSVFGHP